MTDTSTAPLVRYDVRDRFAVLTFDSPHNRNALSARLVADLLRGLDDAAADPAVRGIVLTHTGNTFCAGADLSEAGDTDPAVAADQRTRTMIGVLRRLVEIPKPVIARIDGNVRAGGMGIVAGCDIVVAGPGSSFALTEVRIGLAPFMISLTLLPRLEPRAAARYYLTGEKFGAAEAERIGLVTVTAEDPTAEVARLCAELRKGAPQGLAEAKRLVNAPILAEFDRSAEELAQRSASFFGTPEVREGMTAFLQRRPPTWAE
ncbi:MULTISPECIES: enoyl-CoA hydratase family protein [Nocardia]|uniref:enoyl-CoA hydratase family protein n=1 Tax=Nocardia TaxID=1817 RepID=UPI000BF17305|nr:MULTISPECIES: enoyl-CoA hydratase family protein [Nocardia]MBF6186841.1 enoyl-CoA hydratase family protein [Nocardia farcinica]MBF6253001.1 enoyl-CoA hydratase family protein [Nocardia farcinica]MBF6312070.1 enoyl-CoA hydratase family protein [Nocardia farcinica]MBF6406945.1 enoyl-CoA hydratase family protein [Nocardia farcinica]MBF6442776.1 enoyl-CoA hydratase family protein [Nocardia farcinica]